MGIFLNKISQTIFTVAYMKGVEQKHSSLRELCSHFRWPRLFALSQIQKPTTNKMSLSIEAILSPQILTEKGKQGKITNCAVTF